MGATTAAFAALGEEQASLTPWNERSTRVLQEEIGCHAQHSHPDSVAVFLEDQKAKMTHPDGKSEEVCGKKGEAV